MIKQNILIATRNILKDKVLSSLNFINLIAGFATFILMSLFVESEFSWDKHNVNYDRIYRLQLFMNQEENKEKHSHSVTAALSRHELTTIPEIEKVVLMHDVGDNNKDGVFFSLDKKNQYKIRWGYYVDPSVFDIFTFKFIEGNPSTALNNPFSIVLSKSVAQKLFPSVAAIGKQIYGENKISFTVTGIYEDLPKNSEWLPTYLVPMNTFTAITGWQDYENDYRSYSFTTFVLLKSNAKSESVDAKIENSLANYKKEHHPYLRPLSLIHTNPYFRNDVAYVLILLSLSSILILTLTSFNYINLQTVRGTTRLKEIGIKKTVGFTKKQLYTQFIFESVFISLLAGILSVLITQMILPLFNYLIGTNGYIGVGLTNNVFTKPLLIGLIIGVSILTGLISGLYPAFVISSFNPVKALKLKNGTEKKGFGLKKTLVILQFTISLFLLISSFMVYLQTEYMTKGDLGFNKQSVVFANIVTSNKGSFEPIYRRLLQHPEIQNACFSNYIPFIIPGGDDLSQDGSDEDKKVFFRRYLVSHNFFQTYDIPIIEGRNFSKEYPDDYSKCIINETAAKVLKWDNPIGKYINYHGQKIEVIGMSKDFIAQSMHNPVEPHWYRLVKDSSNQEGIYSLKIAPGETKKAMKIIKSEFSEIFPNDAFEFTHIQTIITNENANRAWKVIRNMSIFYALISIIISSVGLFGLVMFYSKKKMKEIGIRKVVGFTAFDLYKKMSSEFLWLLLIAAIVAWPSAYYYYLNFPGAHKYPLGIGEFIAGTAIILGVAIFTISYHIIKSIRTNPVEILKYE
jgi:putative ABC transport system permease protein